MTQAENSRKPAECAMNEITKELLDALKMATLQTGCAATSQVAP